MPTQKRRYASAEAYLLFLRLVDSTGGLYSWVESLLWVSTFVIRKFVLSLPEVHETSDD